MICNPTEVLDNISVEDMNGNVYNKKDPEYDKLIQGGYYDKYLKYKAKYLKLKQKQSN